MDMVLKESAPTTNTIALIANYKLVPTGGTTPQMSNYKQDEFAR